LANILPDVKRREKRTRAESYAQDRAAGYGIPNGTPKRAKFGGIYMDYRRGEAPGDAKGRPPAKGTAGYSSPWNKFEKKVQQGKVRMFDIPFPTTHYHDPENVLHLSPGDKRDAAKRKDKFKKVALRWHPDKFMAKYGEQLVEEEREAIKDKLNTHFQAINGVWAAMK